MSTPTHIAWVDLESTDTDPFSQHAAILEVGVIVTRHDPQLTEVARASLLIRPPGAQPEHDMMWSRMNPFVRDMHTANGLWKAATSDEEAWDLTQADTQLAVWLRDVVREDGGDVPVPIAGSGVAHLDTPMIKVHMPVFASQLTYWMLDIGQVRRMMNLAGRGDHVDLVTDVDAKPHRGLADVELHVAEARRYLRMLATVGAAEQPAPPEAEPAAAEVSEG